MSEISAVTMVIDVANKAIEHLGRQNKQYKAALEAWYEYWNDRYDGAPLKDYEILMLKLLEKSL